MKIGYTRLREILFEELKNVECPPVVLPFDKDFLNNLLFELGGFYKIFAPSLKEILSKINFSNVSFDYFRAGGFDFSPYFGIKINPQTIYSKDLDDTICKGVEFIGDFYDVRIRGTNFTGSKGAKINPQFIKKKNMSNAKCCDVKFISLEGEKNIDFYGVNIEGTDFTGSNCEFEQKEVEQEFRQKIKELFLQNNIPR